MFTEGLGRNFTQVKSFVTQLLTLRVFPAHAGMNRAMALIRLLIMCVPRTRGDEPVIWLRLVLLLWCSPHTRG